MRKLFKVQNIFCLLLLLGVGSLGAQEENNFYYDHRVPGDRALSITAGPLFPLGFQSFSGEFAASNLNLGGTLDLSVEFYLTQNIRMGGDLRGLMAYTKNQSLLLFLVPITVKADYEFNLFPFTFPVGLGAGVCFNSFNDTSNINPILIPEAGAFWNINSAWSAGITASYWMDFDLYFGSDIPSSQDRLGHFVDLSLSAIYHF